MDDLEQSRGQCQNIGTMRIAAKAGGEQVERAGETVGVAGEAKEECSREAVGAMLSGIPDAMGQVVGKIVVRYRDVARLAVDIYEALRGASALDGFLKVTSLIFQFSASTKNLSEPCYVVFSLKYVLAVVQEVAGLGEAPKAQERRAVVESCTGGLVSAGATPLLNGGDLV
ncbi:MAG: hypothetical protein DLM60_00985, partial [Pseudonocardiales bacterium]